MFFEHNNKDTADFTIMGLYPDDLNRNMNQWHYLLWGGDLFTFKPAFRLQDNGRTQFVEIPVNSFDELMQTFRKPADTLHLEQYLPVIRLSCHELAFRFLTVGRSC